MIDQPTNAQLGAFLNDLADTHDKIGPAGEDVGRVLRLAAQRLEAREEITEAKVQTMWVELVRRKSIAASLTGEDLRAALAAAREA